MPAPPNCVSNGLEEEEGGGYLIVWVIDSPSSGRAIKFDGLIGDEVIAGSSTSARAHGAIPIQAGEGLATLDLTDLNGDTNLDFDDAEYREVTGKVYGSLPYEQPGIPERETSLILLTLDVHSNVQNPVTSAGLSFSNAIILATNSSTGTLTIGTTGSAVSTNFAGGVTGNIKGSTQQ